MAIKLTGGGGGGTPDPHAPTHEDGGSDELIVQNLDSADATSDTVLVADGSGGAVFSSVPSHAAAHIDGGSDEIIIQNLATGVTTSGTVLVADGSGGAFFSSVPSHASSHNSGGSDEITAQNLGSGAAGAGTVLTADGAGGLSFAAGAAPALEFLDVIEADAPEVGELTFGASGDGRDQTPLDGDVDVEYVLRGFAQVSSGDRDLRLLPNGVFVSDARVIGYQNDGATITPDSSTLLLIGTAGLSLTSLGFEASFQAKRFSPSDGSVASRFFSARSFEDNAQNAFSYIGAWMDNTTQITSLAVNFNGTFDYLYCELFRRREPV